eukprot:snap_masked-scaffold_14-processed-gene-5.23-mRNA-1 protein AED:1.00 eAED:1.00 QI:0/0/0/0/1/1/2/0/63
MKLTINSCIFDEKKKFNEGRVDFVDTFEEVKMIPRTTIEMDLLHYIHDNRCVLEVFQNLCKHY